MNASSAVAVKATTIFWKISPPRELSDLDGSVVAMANYLKGLPKVLLCILKTEYTVAQEQTLTKQHQKMHRHDDLNDPSDPCRL